MGWLRRNLTYANVMATVAVFLVLGGGTALASFVVSSNSQVGPNTISGHHPPTGDHANLINGSIASQDLQARSVNGVKVENGSLSGADLANDTLTGQQIDESTLDSNVLQHRVTGACVGSGLGNVKSGIQSIAQNGSVNCNGQSVVPIHMSLSSGTNDSIEIGQVEVDGFCHDGAAGTKVRFLNIAGSSAGTLNWLFSNGTNVNASGAALSSGGFHDFDFSGTRIEGQFIYSDLTDRSETTVSLHAIDQTSCEIFGTATRAEF